MFIGAEVVLDAGFNAAQARLANLARDGLLRQASDDAYHQWRTGLARIGPLGPVPGLSRLVRVQLSDMNTRRDAAVMALRWEAVGTAGALFPVLDADIKLTPAGQATTLLTLSGAYRPPLGGLGAGLDRAIMHRLAQVTIRAFTQQIGNAIAHPATSPQAAPHAMPQQISQPEPETP